MAPPRFHYNKDRSHLTIDNSVASIPKVSFPCIETIITVVLPAGLRKIGDGAFLNCTSLRNIELNEGLESIGEGVFVGCTSITRICIPSTVGEIGARAFNECTSLKELQLCEGSLHKIDGSFQGCTSLEHITFPSTVKNIYGGAFDRCISLKELHLCEGIREIGVAFHIIDNHSHSIHSHNHWGSGCSKIWRERPIYRLHRAIPPHHSFHGR